MSGKTLFRKSRPRDLGSFAAWWFERDTLGDDGSGRRRQIYAPHDHGTIPTDLLLLESSGSEMFRRTNSDVIVDEAPSGRNTRTSVTR